MTPFSGSGGPVARKVLVSLLVAVILFLAGAILSNSNRITATEVKIEAIYDNIQLNRTQLEQNRLENREEHRVIVDKIDALADKTRSK